MLLKKNNIIISVCILFILINAVFTYQEFYWLNLLPFAVLVLYLAFFALDKLLLLVVFLTPLSVNLEHLPFGLGVALPTEPIMFGVMLIYFMRVLFTGQQDIKLLKHPLSILIITYFSWMFFTSVVSELPTVSFKYFLSQLWFVVCFYFLLTKVFVNYENIERFIWLYIIPLSGIIIYTVIHHSQFGFMQKPAHWVMRPFFHDHTSYGAIMAMYFPLLIFLLRKKYSNTTKLLLLSILVIFCVGLVLSYTRAAWISLAAVFGLYFVYLFRIKFSYLIGSGILILAVFFTFKTEILMKLEKNKTDSSTNLSEHVKSISNIRSDASNLERINRWQAAFRLFRERPITGWGPRTYAFVYAPFQLSSEKTIISTNMGDMGNAHSEYIGPLAEMGLPGALLFVSIVLMFLYNCHRLYYQLENKEMKFMVLMILLGFTTYAIHGMLNNFLDSDKASVPFWGFMAMITAIEIFHLKKGSLPSENQ
jgi:putative inorganic carbon (hco3(-)) transporter